MQTRLKKGLPNIFMILLGAFLLLVIPYQISDIQISTMSPRFFPYFLSALIVIISIGTLLSELKTAKSGEEDTEFQNEKPSYTRVVIILLGLIAWLCLVPLLGFILTTLLLTMGMMLLIGNRRLLQVLTVPFIFTLLIYYVFKMIMNVPLPEGLFY